MLFHAKNGCVPVGDTDMYYVSFGRGEKALVILPGLSDGLATVRGKALMLAWPYRRFLRDYTVYMFSRKNAMPDGYSIRDMAADQAAACEALGLRRVSVMGVSQGGMIVQHLAVDHPDLVEKLVIAVSVPRCDDALHAGVQARIDMAERGDHKSLMIDAAEKGYTEKTLRVYRLFYPFLGLLARPKDGYRRFLINARAIQSFNASAELGRIACPTLILGGAEDRTVGAAGSAELHEAIPGSELYIFPDAGHAVYEEAPDFYDRVFRFLDSPA